MVLVRIGDWLVWNGISPRKLHFLPIFEARGLNRANPLLRDSGHDLDLLTHLHHVRAILDSKGDCHVHPGSYGLLRCSLLCDPV